jgi:hypothetical protein
MAPTSSETRWRADQADRMTPFATNVFIWARVHKLKREALEAASSGGRIRGGETRPSLGTNFSPSKDTKEWEDRETEALTNAMHVITKALANNDIAFRTFIGRRMLQAARKLDPHLKIACVTRVRAH